MAKTLIAIMIVLCLICFFVGRARGAALATLDYTTSGVQPVDLTAYILSLNPPCAEGDKVFTDDYGKLATTYCKDNKRWRPWVCRPTGQEGVDIESLPECFGK